MDSQQLIERLTNLAQEMELGNEDEQCVASILYLTIVSLYVGDISQFRDHCRGSSEALGAQAEANARIKELESQLAFAGVVLGAVASTKGWK